MEPGYKIRREGAASYSVEAFFRYGPVQRFSAMSGFKTEAEARQWVCDQRAPDDEAVTRERGGG
jgi:hypothetical protein